VAGILTILAVITWAETAPARETGKTRARETGKWTLPVLRFTAEDGTARRIPSPDGVTVLVFWADWCRACLGKLGDYDRLWRQVAGKGHQIVGINLDPDEETFRTAKKKYGVSFPCLQDPEGLLLEHLIGGTLPRVVAVDSSGRIVFRGEGSALDLDALRRLLL
jgi:thiol-disulfide isomerase/thioredoxin